MQLTHVLGKIAYLYNKRKKYLCQNISHYGSIIKRLKHDLASMQL
jgi:hypothetical protein